MTPTQTFIRLFYYFLKYKWRVLTGLFAVTIMSFSDTANAYLVAKLISVLQKISEQLRIGQDIHVQDMIAFWNKTIYLITVDGKQQSFELIYKFAIAAIIIIIVKVFFVYVREYLMSSVQQKILMRFRIDLFNRIVALPVRYFDKHKTGHIMSRITNDIFNLEQSLYLIVEISQNILYSVVYSTALFFINWQLTIVTIIIFGLSGEISRKFGDRIRSYGRAISNTLAEISAFLQERIAGIRIVKSFVREEKERDSFKQKVETNYHYSMKIVRVTALLSPTNELFNTTASSLLIIFCGYLFIQGSMSIDNLIFFVIMMINLAKPVKALGEGMARVQKTLVSAGYIFEIIDHKAETDLKTRDYTHIANGEVEFCHVTFSYNKQLHALKDINLKVNAGEKIALVGQSGGGKSTLINLIPRFYELEKGEIKIDGININDFDLKSLRNQLAIVPQDVILFSGTIFTNIQYGRLDASQEEVIQAAKAANAHQFIEQLENGYETEVGERGLQLSGGQRQRIAIARAILRNPRILLLDEATSALDTESELMVKEALNRLMEGRTSFIIAHRLSTIAHCDRIVVLENGSIVELGTHEELIKIDSGLYKRLHSLQFSDNPS